MSTPLPSDTPPDPDREIQAVLIQHFHLSSQNIHDIYEAMQTSSLSFVDAAVHLKVVTSDQLADARRRLGDGGARAGAGLIEAAIRRVSSGRSLVVRHGEVVTPGPRLILAQDPYNPRSEKIRALRTELLLLNEGARGANIVPILSACTKEGRSQLAAELAISFAQLGRRTLLVDADLRNPSQHTFFDAANDQGLSRALTRSERPQFNPVSGLPLMHLLTAGSIAPNPLELLSDGRFERLLSEWRNTYEFIVIDTPPVSQCADGLAVASLVARVLIVSRTQRTSYKNTKLMLRRLATTQSTILGAVLNTF